MRTKKYWAQPPFAAYSACSQLMNWNSQFAERTSAMRRTAVRELLKVSRIPGMISFAGGIPAPEFFPVPQIRAALDAALSRSGRASLQYGETEGMPELREAIAAQFSTPSLSLTRDNVLITSGGQQALDLIGRVLLDPGDAVLVENPTYLALLAAWRPLGVRFIPIQSDKAGLITDNLPKLLELKPKLLYVVPNFQNPQATTLTLPRRQELIRWARAAGVGVVEDNPYGALRYDGNSLPHLFELGSEGSGNCETGPCIHVGTFSKVLAPGLRVGWVVGPRAVIDKLVQAKQAADLHTSTLSQSLVFELLDLIPKQVQLLQAAYRQRRDAMLQALQNYFPPDCSWSKPDGGMFLWLQLSQGTDAKALLNRALERKVAFVPGEEFHWNGGGQNTARLSFCQPDCALITEGIQRLADVLKTMGNHEQGGLKPALRMNYLKRIAI